INIYSDAVLNTLYIVIRLLLMVTLTTLLTATTKPLELTLGLEQLMKPLARLHVPTHEIAMMISIALRFIPTIIEETERIMNAQKSRGVDFDEGSLKEKISAILSLIVPLFSVAFQRADDLANAMEARGYVPGAERTRYKELIYHGRDHVLRILSLLILAGTIVLAFVL
ncbi:MAG: energy-coupling factor transporter transmembrane protein EcfT, partial [Erysipelotrichaceae bacterium]|nr:energy-coupling factor transporter transmembrane protein EcfT [Erysipelotrichaceae bacterium]